MDMHPSKGTKLGWSTAYKIYFDEPEEKSGGASMELKWESFSVQSCLG